MLSMVGALYCGTTMSRQAPRPNTSTHSAGRRGRREPKLVAMADPLERDAHGSEIAASRWVAREVDSASDVVVPDHGHLGIHPDVLGPHSEIAAGELEPDLGIAKRRARYRRRHIVGETDFAQLYVAAVEDVGRAAVVGGLQALGAFLVIAGERGAIEEGSGDGADLAAVAPVEERREVEWTAAEVVGKAHLETGQGIADGREGTGSWGGADVAEDLRR